MKPNKIVSFEEWKEAQNEFSKFEKEAFERLKMTAEKRRELPWLWIQKQYNFEGPNGQESLSDLFQGRSQLILQHFMFAPENHEGCAGCSSQADGVDGARPHFESKDVSFVAVSRAPITKIEAFRKRMGWDFKWVSSGSGDFNYDFHVSFTKEELAVGKAVYGFERHDVNMPDLPGISVFYKDKAGEVFRTYSNFEGDDHLLGFYGYLDITPKGRHENQPLDWIKHHDRY